MLDVREIVCAAIDLLYMLIKELNVSSSTQISNLFLKVKILSDVNMKLVVGSPSYFIHYTLSFMSHKRLTCMFQTVYLAEEITFLTE